MITVRFENVGEKLDERLTFDAELSEFTGQEIIQAIKRSRALRPKTEPDVWYDDQRGIIYVGGHKPVGTFSIVPASNKTVYPTVSFASKAEQRRYERNKQEEAEEPRAAK